MNPLIVVNVIAIIFFACWIGFALLTAINPHFVWRMRSGWKATKEPPKSYFIFQRVWGVLFAMIGIGFLIFVNSR